MHSVFPQLEGSNFPDVAWPWLLRFASGGELVMALESGHRVTQVLKLL
jgi:hypothetical protein